MSHPLPQSSTSKSWGMLFGPKNAVNHVHAFYAHSMQFTAKVDLLQVHPFAPPRTSLRRRVLVVLHQPGLPVRPAVPLPTRGVSAPKGFLVDSRRAHPTPSCKRVCRFHQRGVCHFGRRCHNLHLVLIWCRYVEKLQCPKWPTWVPACAGGTNTGFADLGKDVTGVIWYLGAKGVPEEYFWSSLIMCLWNGICQSYLSSQ